MNIILPENLMKLIKVFNKNNYKCYLVGGFIRDVLMNTKPKEFDICTNAKTKDIKLMFKVFKDENYDLGSIKVFFRKTWFEITTLRIEKDYVNFRYPNSVKFIDDYKIDALRRDFTINAIYHDGKSLLDPLNGIEDIKKSLLRIIGNKNLKFSEDPLRILRCLNFKSRFNFKIEFSTLISLKNNFHLIKHLTTYRIHTELIKIFENKTSYECIKIFNLLRGFQIILNNDFEIFDFNPVLNIVNKFNIKIFCILYFHSNMEKNSILHIIKNKLNFTKRELLELHLLFKTLTDNKKKNSNLFIKKLILDYDYDITFIILNVLENYDPLFKNILYKFFKIKWGYAPIKISHLNITLGKILKNKKNITKYNKYLVMILHIKPKLNERNKLLHLIKTKFKL